jgi:hypothetical protein
MLTKLIAPDLLHQIFINLNLNGKNGHPIVQRFVFSPYFTILFLDVWNLVRRHSHMIFAIGAHPS